MACVLCSSAYQFGSKRATLVTSFENPKYSYQLIARYCGSMHAVEIRPWRTITVFNASNNNNNKGRDSSEHGLAGRCSG